MYESRDQLTTILSDHAEHHFYALRNWCLRLRHFGRSLVFEYVVTSVNMLVLPSEKKTETHEKSTTEITLMLYLDKLF